MKRLVLNLIVVGASLINPVTAIAQDSLNASANQSPDEEQRLAPIDFVSEIRPLLSDRCFACHGPDEENRESDLRFDDYESVMEDRGDYQVVKPGDPDSSELMRRIVSDDTSEVMPPVGEGKPLTDEEKELFRRWISSGAAWQKHWAYELPRSVPTPQLSSLRGAGENWIDAFVARQQLRVRASFSDRADHTTLIRRLYFDLVGLPPDPDSVQQFKEDSSPDAWQRLVDELLAAPAFGERLAIYWLDLVRYADTVGYHGDQDHNISPYRDYVIHSLNDNRPFDLFTIDQLAGDLVASPTEEQIVATGYNRLLQTSHEGGVQPKEYLTIYQADRVRNISAVWMGATLGCAQCHDHKFDPYTSEDFYAMAAFFADVDEEQHFKLGNNSLPTRRPPERDVLTRGEKLLLTRYEAQLSEIASRLEQHGDQPQVVGKTADGSDADPGFHELQALIAERDALQARIVALKKSARKTMVTSSIEPRVVRYLPRGNWLDDSGEVMEPSIPDFLGELAIDGRASRLHLARWLTDDQHGVGLMTARVFVNRLWMLLFGQGLSRSVEDFGGQGRPPSHPQLLDQLAIEFVRSGWDIKHMFRLIVTSRTYQQSSLENSWHREHDPENIWLTRQNRFRISAEMVRDTTLSCSGLLVRYVGGASVRPYQPAGYYRHLNFPTRSYDSTRDEGQWRRGLYVHWQRQFLHPMLRAFDAPTREECTAQRPESNTPLAALVWLNDPSFIEAARSLAHRVMLVSESADDRIKLLYRITLSRDPDGVELGRLKQLLSQAVSEFTESPSAASSLLDVGISSKPSDFSEVELAAWLTVARAILNLSETYTRN